MKKVLSILAILVFSLLLVSCKDKEDLAQGYLDSAYDSLSVVVSDPSNVTGNFQVPTTLANGVTAVWTSSNTGVATVGTPASGFSLVTVNRPLMGEDDVELTLSVVLSVPSALDETDILTKEWSVVITVIANTVEIIVVDDIEDVLAITDASYDEEYQVTLDDMTIFAKGSDTAFAYDGTGIIAINYGDQDLLVQGSVYTIAGTINWYYGLWEIQDWTATVQSSSTAQVPTKEVVTSVDTKIDALIADGQNLPATGDPTDGNMEPIYATVTGIVHLIPLDTSDYNTYIVDTTYDEDTWVKGTAGVPAEGFMVYYNTLDFTTLRLYDGLEVTIDVVIYTYRSNNNAFAIYYVGGPEGISANLSDTEKQAIDAGSLSVPLSTTEAITLELPATGANGSTIVWSFTDTEDTNNSYVNLTTGAVTVPTGEQVTVGITATVSFTGLDDIVVDFEIKIGEYPISTVAEAIALGDGAIVRVVGIVTDTTDSAGYGAYWLQDASGALDLFNKYSVFTEDMIGKTYEVIGEIDLYNGLWEIVVADEADLVEVTGDDALTMPTAVDISDMTLDAETLLPYQGMLVDLSGFVLEDDLDATYTSSFTIYFVNDAGEQISVRLDKDVPGFADFVTTIASATAGTAFDFTNVIVGWYNGPQLLVPSNATIVAGTAYTNQQLLDSAAALLSVPAANAEVVSNLTLPSTGIFDTTVAWTSSNTDVITTTGTVTRPANGSGDATVTLSYVVSLDTLSTTAIEIIFTVLEAPAVAPTGTLVIYEAYGGGGNTGSIYTNDYIVLYNGTDAAIDLTGYSVQYASSTGTTWSKTDLTGSIAAGAYYLIQEGAGSGGTTALPTPDATGTLSMSGTKFKLALVNSTTLLTGANPTSDSSVIDFVGFGNADAFEGTVAPELSNTTSGQRTSFIDTNDNGADFAAVATDLSYLAG